MAEGSLFWRTAGYRSRAEQTFKALAPDCALSIAHVENANLLGAAVAALVRNQE